MARVGMTFAEALAQAQRLGYAEADPSEDVDGRDAAAKMAILARLAFDTPVHLDQVRYEGIEHIQPDDLAYADELGLVLKLIEWTGPNWWIWAAVLVIAFQLLLMLIAPAVIMPLFNKFTPLPEGSTLRERLFALALRTNFPTRSIEVMDGSKRSRHSIPISQSMMRKQ